MNHYTQKKNIAYLYTSTTIYQRSLSIAHECVSNNLMVFASALKLWLNMRLCCHTGGVSFLVYWDNKIINDGRISGTTQQGIKIPLSNSPCPPEITTMTRSMLSEASNRQSHRRLSSKKLSDAVQEYWIEKFEKGKASYREIADKFGVNCLTLANIKQGKHRMMTIFNTSKQKLSAAEEDVLVNVVILASCQGIPYTHDHIREEAVAILENHRGSQHRKTGKCWVQNFLHCHNDHLRTYWLAPLPSMRARAGNQESIAGYFALVKEHIVDLKVPVECVWSMDKTQVNPNGTSTQWVVGESRLYHQHQQGLSNKQVITVLVTIGVDGSSISPTTIFKGKKIPVTWKANNVSKMVYVIG